MAELRSADRLPAATQSVRVWPGVVAAVSATIAGAAALVVSMGLAPASPVSGPAPPLLLSWLGALLVMSLVAACWLLVATRPSAATGLSLVALSWILPGLAAWPALGSWARAALLAAAPLAPGGIALLVASWWTALSTRGGGSRSAALWFAAAGAAVHLLGYDPFFDPACTRTCESSPTVRPGALSGYEIAVLVALAVAAASVAATIACTRAARAPFALRISGVIACLVLTVAVVIPVVRWGDPAGGPVVDGLQTFGTVVVGAAVVTALVGEYRVRRAVRDLVRRLSEAEFSHTSPRSVSAVEFAVPRDRRWVDASGRLLTGERTGPAAVVWSADGPAVRLVLSRWAAPGPVLASITPADRLALENARLRAVAQLRLVDLRASQRRIVETTDRERRRIERDLHDGAQQRLVAVAMHLNSAGPSVDHGVRVALGEAADQVREALAALRRLSHDSLVSVLTAEGLLAATEDLIADAPLSVGIEAAVDERTVPAPIQATAYLTVSVALNNVVAHAKTDHARVRINADGQRLVVEVTDHGVGGATRGSGLTSVADRVGALGGSFEIVSQPGVGTTVRAVLPCE